MRRRLQADVSLCCGCRYCELACSYAHHGKYNPRLSRIRIIKGDEVGMDVPLACKQCNICIPAEKCPVDAMIRDSNGAVIILEDRCIGCGECISNCPFGSVSWSPLEDEPILCDLCDGDPACVKKCPTHALSFEDPGQFAGRKQLLQAKNRYENLLSEWGIEELEGDL